MCTQGGAALEAAHAVSAVVFDKTGTLTEGRPGLVEAFLLPQQLDAAATASVLSLTTLMRIFAAAESFSEHPIGRAIAMGAKQAAAESAGGSAASLPPYEVDTATYEVVPGCGLRCKVSVPAGDLPPAWPQPAEARGSPATPVSVVLGNRAWLAENGAAATPAAEAVLAALESRGRTAVLAAVGGRAVAVLGVADRVKPEAFETVAALRALGVDVWMVTGDHRDTALHVAAAIGIPPERVIAGVRPGDKAGKVNELQAPLVSVEGGRCVYGRVDDWFARKPPFFSSHRRARRSGASLRWSATESMTGPRLPLQMSASPSAQARRSPLPPRVSSSFAPTSATSSSRSTSAAPSCAASGSTSCGRSATMPLGSRWVSKGGPVAFPPTHLPHSPLPPLTAAGVLFPLTHASVAPQVAGLAMALSSVSVVLSSLLLRRYARPDIAALAASGQLAPRIAAAAKTPRQRLRERGVDDEAEAAPLTSSSSVPASGATPLSSPLEGGEGAANPWELEDAAAELRDARRGGIHVVDLAGLRPACSCPHARCRWNKLITTADWQRAVKLRETAIAGRSASSSTASDSSCCAGGSCGTGTEATPCGC